MISPSDSFSLSACERKSCYPSATSEVYVVTSICFVYISSRTLKKISSVTLSSNLVKKAALVENEKAFCAFLKWVCNTWSHSFQSDGYNVFVSKKFGSDLLFFKTIVSCVASPQKVYKIGKFQINCQKFFRKEEHFELCRLEEIWSKLHRGLRLQLWLDPPFWYILNHESRISALEAYVGHQDRLMSREELL